MLSPSRIAMRLVVIVSLLALFAVACEHMPVSLNPGVVTTINVAPNPDTLPINAATQFSAIGLDADGNEVGIDPTWSVEAGGGNVNDAGVFTAGTDVGTFANTVTASVGSVSGSASVTVTGGPVAAITVTPNPDTLAVDATQQFTAVASDAGGNVVAISPNWSVAAGGGSIDDGGLFTAGTEAGTYANTVTASVGDVEGTATVTVTPGPLASVNVTPDPTTLAIGGTEQFTAVGRDAYGNPLSITPTWSVVASGGTIDGSGLFTAGAAAGIFANTVRATAGGFSDFATVTVTSGALATITVTPDPVSVGTDASQQFVAVGRDASGNIIPIEPAPTWSVVPGNAGGTILNPSGVYTAPALAGSGIDTVQATSGAIVGSARVNVAASGALTTIAVTPNPANVNVGGTVQFTATGFDATGLIVPTPGLAWSVVAGGGTIDGGTGEFAAGVVEGTFPNTVRATSGTVSGYATVIVNPPPQPGPSLGAAETHGLLAGSEFTCAGGPGTIDADASVWPGSSFSGFPPCVITGETHAADAFAQTAQGDLTEAYNALAAMPCGTTITADLGGTTLAPGVYCSLTSVGVTGTVTLDGNGDENALFVIRAPSTLTTAGDVVLQNGAQARNVYWWVGSSATLGTNSDWQGNILALQSITLVDTVTLCGRALARNGAVDMGTGDTIKLPPVAAATCTFP